MTVTMRDPEREERRREQAEIADSLKESGALDGIFARIDAGEPLTGHAGLLKGMLKATLERGLDTELADHVGYDRGDPAASSFPNSRNGTFAKTVASEIGLQHPPKHVDGRIMTIEQRGRRHEPDVVSRHIRHTPLARAQGMGDERRGSRTDTS